MSTSISNWSTIDWPSSFCFSSSTSKRVIFSNCRSHAKRFSTFSASSYFTNHCWLLLLCYFLFTVNLISALSHDWKPKSASTSDESNESLDNTLVARSSQRSKSASTYKNSAIVASFSLLDANRGLNGRGESSLPPPLHSLNRRQTNFSHLVLDPVRSQLYVGGTNYVLQLDHQLNLLRRLRTGPLFDSAHCSPTDCSGVDSKDIRMSNNYNKALLLEPNESQLIACGSSKQGACFRWSLDNQNTNDRLVAHGQPLELAITEQMLIKVPVAANDENSSTVAFVGPAHYDQPASNVLYVAVTNTKLGTVCFLFTF